MHVAFADDMAQQLQSAGINVPASSIPDQDTLSGGLNSLTSWVNSLDDNTKGALDDVTGSFPVKAGLADPSVNIAPGLQSLLQAMDQLQASIPISTVIVQLNQAMQALQQPPSA